MAESADDAFLAAWVVLESGEAASISQLAAERAGNSAVRQLAQTLQTDHRAIVQELESRTQESGRGAAGKKSEPAPAAKGAPGCEHVVLLRELGEAGQSSLKAELSEKQGAEFDRCYLRWVIGSHHCAMGQVAVLQRHASTELSGVLRGVESRIAGHLERAKAVAKELEGAPGVERGSRGN